jgi:Tol biopolymer transport system component
VSGSWSWEIDAITNNEDYADCELEFQLIGLRDANGNNVMPTFSNGGRTLVYSSARYPGYHTTNQGGSVLFDFNLDVVSTINGILTGSSWTPNQSWKSADYYITGHVNIYRQRTDNTTLYGWYSSNYVTYTKP